MSCLNTLLNKTATAADKTYIIALQDLDSHIFIPYTIKLFQHTPLQILKQRYDGTTIATLSNAFIITYV